MLHSRENDLLQNIKQLEVVDELSLMWRRLFTSSHPEVLLGKGALKICSKVTGEHACRSVVFIKLQSNWSAFSFGVSQLSLPN